MTDDHPPLPDSLQELSESFDDLSEGLSEYSGSLDETLDWKTRFATAWEDLSKLAQGREGVTEFLLSWLPVVLAARSLGSTIWRLGNGLRLAVMDGDEFNLPDEFLEELKKDFNEVGDAFPDAATILFGVDRLDDLINDILSDDNVRNRFSAFGTELLKLGDGLVSRAIDIVLSAEEKDVSASEFSQYLENLEKALQKVIDRALPL